VLGSPAVIAGSGLNSGEEVLAFLGEDLPPWRHRHLITSDDVRNIWALIDAETMRAGKRILEKHRITSKEDIRSKADLYGYGRDETSFVYAVGAMLTLEFAQKPGAGARRARQPADGRSFSPVNGWRSPPGAQPSGGLLMVLMSPHVQISFGSRAGLS